MSGIKTPSCRRLGLRRRTSRDGRGTVLARATFGRRVLCRVDRRFRSRQRRIVENEFIEESGYSQNCQNIYCACSTTERPKKERLKWFSVVVRLLTEIQRVVVGSRSSIPLQAIFYARSERQVLKGSRELMPAHRFQWLRTM